MPARIVRHLTFRGCDKGHRTRERIESCRLCVYLTRGSIILFSHLLFYIRYLIVHLSLFLSYHQQTSSDQDSSQIHSTNVSLFKPHNPLHNHHNFPHHHPQYQFRQPKCLPQALLRPPRPTLHPLLLHRAAPPTTSPPSPLRKAPSAAPLFSAVPRDFSQTSVAHPLPLTTASKPRTASRPIRKRRSTYRIKCPDVPSSARLAAKRRITATIPMGHDNHAS
jgi:hypothetical protein